MPLEIAQSHAWRIACTLMACIIVLEIGDSLFGVVEAQEFDGDVESIVREYDPFAH